MPAPKRGRLLPAELVGEVLDSSPVPLVTRPVAAVPGSLARQYLGPRGLRRHPT